MTKDQSFDIEAASRYLRYREEKIKEKQERERRAVLNKTIRQLRKFFRGMDVEACLIGSILRLCHFGNDSDIDIAVKNYQGERPKLWSSLEDLLERKIDLLIYKKCSFKKYIVEFGCKVQ